jgi:hypothetical protein
MQFSRCAFLACVVLSASGQVEDGPQFNAAGELARPANYREWVYLSSGLGMTYGPAATVDTANPLFDNVFVNRSAYQAFKQTGKWPDNTMFVLEVRNSKSKESINNGGRFQGDTRAIEAEVKSGGEWTFYGFDGNGATARPIPRTASCYSCHGEHGAVDNTFVQFYPTLLPIAREKGTLK